MAGSSANTFGGGGDDARPGLEGRGGAMHASGSAQEASRHVSSSSAWVARRSRPAAEEAGGTIVAPTHARRAQIRVIT